MRLIYTDDDIQQYLEVRQGESTLGRSSKATFTIRNDTISKVHIKFTLDGGVFEVEDLGSSNGTFVNGVKISKVKLKPKDSLKIGKFDFTLEFSAEELATYQNIDTEDSSDTDTPAPDDITPLGSEAITEEEKGAASETFFDVASLKNSNVPAHSNADNMPSTAGGAGAVGPIAPSAAKSILANRKLLLMITGGFCILMMMVLILKDLGSSSHANTNYGNPKVANKNLDRYERLLKEGVVIFKSNPAGAKKMFSEAMDNVSNKNSCLALIRMCDIWLESNKGWFNIKRTEFRKLLDDLRNEDEGQPGAMLFEFIKQMSDEERESLKVENEFAKFVSFLEQGMISDAEKKILDIERDSPLRSMAESRFKMAKLKLINTLKDDVEIARTSSNVQMELRKITALVKFLDPSETIDYRKRMEKLRKDLEKGKIWIDGSKLYQEKNYVEAKDVLKLLEPTDEHYSDAQTIIKEIELDEVKKQVQLFYEMQGDGKTAIAIIDKSYSASFLELKDKIALVDKTFDEALRLGEIDQDNSKAHDLMQKIIELEPNSENAYNKKAQEYLAAWTDPINKCKRLYEEAKKKLVVRDFDKARDLIESIQNTNNQYDVSDLMVKIERHIGSEMNKYVRNSKSDTIKKRTLEVLNKIVRRGDKYYDEIQEKLLEVQ